MTRKYPLGADIVIVGSGPIGATYARLITQASPGTSIVMLEAGPRLTQRFGAHVRTIDDTAAQAEAKRLSQGPHSHLTSEKMASPDKPLTPNQYPARPGTFVASDADTEMPGAALSSCVGGMGVHWTCAIPRPGGTEIIPFIAPERMNAALSRAELLLGKQDNVFLDTPAVRGVGGAIETFFASMLEDVRPAQLAPIAARRNGAKVEWQGTDTVFGPLAEASCPSFTLLPDTLCKRIIHKSGKASGVAVVDLKSGEHHEIAAQYVILAADSLRTPQLLYASDIRPKALGRYLNDHLSISATVHVDGDIGAGASTDNAGLDAILAAFWIPFDAKRHPYQGQVTCYGNADATFARLGWFLPKTIDEDNRVYFTEESTDSFGMPGLRFQYRLSRCDHERMARATQEIEELAPMLGQYLPQCEPRLRPLGSSLHYQGTIRMGMSDDGRSVCDPASKVWGFDNIYVGGNGVIPTETACNPTLTSVALAVISAQAIAPA